jgi:hypothetical protein
MNDWIIIPIVAAGVILAYLFGYALIGYYDWKKEHWREN